MTIRVNGRIATQPMSANDAERVFPVGAAAHDVTRQPDGRLFFELHAPAPKHVTNRVTNDTMTYSFGKRRAMWLPREVLVEENAPHAIFATKARLASSRNAIACSPLTPG